MTTYNPLVLLVLRPISMIPFVPFPSGVVALSVVSAVLAAAEITSSSWRKPDVTVSTADRVSIAGSALAKAVSMIALTTAFRGTVFYEMSEYDIVTNQTTYEDTLLPLHAAAAKCVEDPSSKSTTYCRSYSWRSLFYRASLKPPRSMGHAAVRAYQAYKNPVFLQYANQSWQLARAYALSQDDLLAGTLSGKDFTVQATCQGREFVCTSIIMLSDFP
ncbi:hypothetical protein B0H10DRAFT_1931584, partial [Mycena sp. CBHHK59/15]